MTYYTGAPPHRHEGVMPHKGPSRLQDIELVASPSWGLQVNFELQKRARLVTGGSRNTSQLGNLETLEARYPERPS